MFSPLSLGLLFKEARDNPDVHLIVEGKKDKTALMSIGFRQVIDISGKPIEDIVEKVASFRERQVAILTDFDEEGEQIASQLSNVFSHYRINVDNVIRNKFRSLKIHQIEELNSVTKFVEDYCHGEIGPVYNKIFNRSRIHGRRSSRETRRHRSDIRPD